MKMPTAGAKPVFFFCPGFKTDAIMQNQITHRHRIHRIIYRGLDLLKITNMKL